MWDDSAGSLTADANTDVYLPTICFYFAMIKQGYLLFIFGYN